MADSFKQRSLGFNYGMAVLLGSGGFYLGYQIGIFNPLSDPLLLGVYKYDPITDKDTITLFKGLIYMVYSLGCMAGVLASGFLTDILGRRAILYAGEIIALLNIGLYWFVDIKLLMAARVVSGIAAGVNISAFSVIMAEMLPNKICGFGNAFSYTMITAAILLGYFPLVLMSTEQMIEYWRPLVLAPAVVSVLRLVLFPIFIKTETPKYIYTSRNGQGLAEQEILTALSVIYHPEDVETVSKKSIRTFEKQLGEGQISFGSLFSSRYFKRLFSGCFVTFANQVTGINFLIFFSSSLFDKIEGMGKTMTMAIGASNIIGSFLAIYFIGSMGRKFNLVVGVLFQALSMTALYFGFKSDMVSVMVISVCIYISGFAVGFGGTTTAYLSEILPPIGVGLALSVQWIMTALIGQLTPTLVEKFGSVTMLLFFAIMSWVSFLLLDYLVIETKGKSEDAVAREFRDSTYRFMNLL